MVIALYVVADLGVLLIHVERDLIDLIAIVLPTGAEPCLASKGNWFWQKLRIEGI